LSERVIRRPVDGSHDSAVLALVESIEATDVDDVGPVIHSVHDPAQESSNGALAGAVPDLDREQRDVPVDRCEPAPVAPDDGRHGRAVSMEVADRQATWVAVGDDRVVLRSGGPGGRPGGPPWPRRSQRATSRRTRQTSRHARGKGRAPAQRQRRGGKGGVGGGGSGARGGAGSGAGWARGIRGGRGG